MAPYILFSFLFHAVAFYALGELSVAVVTFHSVPMDFYIVDRVPQGVDAGVPAKTASTGKAKGKTSALGGAATALKSSFVKAVVPARNVSKGAAPVGKPSGALTKQEARAGGGSHEEPRPVAVRLRRKAAVASALGGGETFSIESKKAAVEEKPSLKEVAAIGKDEEATRVEPEAAVASALGGGETFSIEPKKAAIEEKPSLKEVVAIAKYEEATRVEPEAAVASALGGGETFSIEPKKAAIEEKPSLKEVAAIVKGEDATRVVVRPTPEVTVSVTMKGSQRASWARSGSEHDGAAAPDSIAALSGYEDIYYMPSKPLRPEGSSKETVNQDAPSVERNAAFAEGTSAPAEPPAKPLSAEEYGARGEQHLETEEAGSASGKQPGEENKAGDAPFPYDRFTISYPDYAVAPRRLQYSLETETFLGVANAVSLEPEEIPEAALAEPLPVEEYAASGEQNHGTEEEIGSASGKQPGEENKAGDAPFLYDRFAISSPDYPAAPRRLEYFLEIETSLDIANVVSLEPKKIPEAAMVEEYSIWNALFPGSFPEEESLGILAAVITPESSTPSNEEYIERVEAEAKLQAKGDGAQSGNSAILAAPGEIVITIEPRGDAEGLRFGLFKKPHPMVKIRRGGNAQIAAQSVPIGEGPKKSVFEFEMADKAVYTFTVENKGAASRVFSVEFRLRGGRLKFYREVSLGVEEAKSFRFLMPEAVFWDDEERFSGSVEGADFVTKFDDASGLVWKEEKQY